MNYATTQTLKAHARAQLTTHYGTLISAMLLVYAFNFIANTILQYTSNFYSISGIIIYYISSCLIQLIISVFFLGYAKLYLNIATNQQAPFNLLFFGFTNQPNKVILVALFKGVITLLACVIPVILFIVLLALLPTSITLIEVVPYYLIFLLIIFAICTYIELRYGQVYFLLADLPSYSPKQIIRLSSTIMNGHMLHLLFIKLSFFGMFLLSVLSCGIGLLWILPYYNITLANFYLDLLRQRSAPTEPSL